MNEYKSVLDKIKENYLKIDVFTYNLLKKILSFLWEKSKNYLDIREKEENENYYQFNQYLKYFNPKKVPSTRLSLIECLPNLEELLTKFPNFKEELKNVLESQILLKIKRVNKNYLLLTPEGLIFIYSIKNSKKYDENFRLNTFIIQKFEKLLLKGYREFIFEKFYNLQITEEKTPSLNNKDIGILLFFIINGSIGEENSFRREGKRTERSINCIVQAFNKNIKFDDEKRMNDEIVPIRILQKDISLLQKKIGYSIHNENRIYYIKENSFQYILKRLKESFIEYQDESEINELKSRWEHFLREYNHWRPILRRHNMCFYDYSVIDKIEKKILNFNKTDQNNSNELLKI